MHIAFARGLVESGQVESAEDIITTFLPRAGFLPDTDTYSEAMIEPLVNLRHYQSAIELCEKLKDDPLMPKPTWRTKYLHALALMHLNETEKAFAIANEILVSAPQELGSPLQTTMLYYTFRNKGLDAGVDLHNKLLTLPSPWTLLGVNASIRMFLQRDQCREASILFAELLAKTRFDKSSDLEITLRSILQYNKLDLETLAILLNSIKTSPRLMYLCFESIREIGLRLGSSMGSPPSPVSSSAEHVDSIFNILANQVQASPDFDSLIYVASKSLLMMAKSAGTLPSKDLAMSIFSLLLRKKRLEDARLWAQDLMAAGIKHPKLEIDDLQAVVTERSNRIIALCHNRGISDANVLFDKTVAEDIMPKITALKVLLGANFAKGDTDKAFQLLIDSLASVNMPESKAKIYEAALSGLGRSGDAQTALVIVRQMSEVLNTAPRNTVILEILAGLSRQKKVSTENMAAAEELFAYITMDTVQPEIFYAIKTNIYKCAGRLKEALDTFECAVTQNVAMSSGFLSDMARLCYQAADPNRMRLALTVHQNLHGNDQLLPILAQAIQLHCDKTHDLEALKELGQVMETLKQQDDECYKQLLFGLCKLDSSMDAARYYFSKAREAGIVGFHPYWVSAMIKGYARQKDFESLEEIRKLFTEMMSTNKYLPHGDLEQIIEIMIQERGSPAHAEIFKNLASQSTGCKLYWAVRYLTKSHNLCTHTI